PGLIVHDTQDEIVGYDSAKTIASGWASAELLTTHGLGHSGILRDVNVITHVVEFLNKGKA
ncbi:MAG: alpha/beta hydrolase, partial [Chloroflexota bacterium]